VILGQKLTLNHPSLVDEGEKKLGFRWRLTREKRGKRETTMFNWTSGSLNLILFS